MNISIRAATMADYEVICQLHEQVDRHHVELLPDVFQEFRGPVRSREAIAAYVEGENADCLVADSDAGVVGLVTIKAAPSPNYPMFRSRTFALIENLAVHEAWRGQGIGSTLMHAAKGWAQARGLGTIQLAVWAANSAAIRFYRKHGFDPILIRMEADG
ncbi:MAG: hypothetical protein A3K19_13910 [Lentisphaerae bacterium RIFOXYB12_FULL_65_16]|nr:MAG: hypothetical protein A3K18_18035 [Lentisphaerae bacterium RIFOXYA12_64_32]OGV94131.1 MAG: hypothetical protein A3K19_13910 [Lentisphaerae bacterium RIFOXYB12_FULL_65_16]